MEFQKKGKLAVIFELLIYSLKNPNRILRYIRPRKILTLVTLLLSAPSGRLNQVVQERFGDLKTASATRNKPIVTDYEVDISEIVSLKHSGQFSGKAKVSIIIPVYNQWHHTYRCLASIAKNTSNIDYEVIIGDDCSTDETVGLDKWVENITVIRNESNLGFLQNCNNAAKKATGEYILFLNNDTYVREGWLTQLCRILDEDSRAGMVGPKLLFDDGKLQEAGGIIWSDGSGWNYGRGDEPGKAEYNYVKETDYISGCCIVLRHSLWLEIGGFDERYTPAYYEDTDLAFAIRDLGYKVIYQPAAEVVHFEGVSHGTDLNSGIKKYQQDNKIKFQKRWEKVLSEQHFPNATNVFQARDKSVSKRTILVIDHYVPFFDKDAGSRSTFMYLQRFVEYGYNVKFIGDNFYPHEPYTSSLQQLGIEVLVGNDYAKNWQSWLRENMQYIDVIYLHRPHVSERYLKFLASFEKKELPKLVYFGHDLHYLRLMRQYEIEGNRELYNEAKKWRKQEYAIFDQVDTILYPSMVEVDEIRETRPDLDVEQLPLYIFDLEDNHNQYSAATREDLLFVGGFNHTPNVDGLEWFVEHVFPLILSEYPNLHLHVVGSNMPDRIEELASENVVIYGYLSNDELDIIYKRSRLSIAPLRYGAGIKGKVLDAFSLGVPIVMTPVAGEGIPGIERLLVTPNLVPEEMANTIKNNYADMDRLNDISTEQFEVLKNSFGRASLESVLDKVF